MGAGGSWPLAEFPRDKIAPTLRERPLAISCWPLAWTGRSQPKDRQKRLIARRCGAAFPGRSRLLGGLPAESRLRAEMPAPQRKFQLTLNAPQSRLWLKAKS